MQTHFHHAAVALALVAGAGAAHAQTVITREVTTEPVETIVEQGPSGTVVTRRLLEMTAPQAPITLPAETIVEEPVDTGGKAARPNRVTAGLSPTAAGPSAAPVSRRHVVAQPLHALAPKQVRTKAQSARFHAVRPPPVGAMRTTAIRPAPLRTTTGIAPAAHRVVAPSLTPAERSTIYRTVVEERVVPRTVITEPSLAAPPFRPPVVATPVVRQQVVTEHVVTAPAPAFRERIETTPVIETVGAAPTVAERVVPDSLTIGSRVPATLPLYALPETLDLEIPVVRPYRYAIVDDRVLLVDPVTATVVAELTE